jgi:hypothetical protein
MLREICEIVNGRSRGRKLREPRETTEAYFLLFSPSLYMYLMEGL